MNREPFQISRGRTVTPHGHHSDKWMLNGSRVTVTEANGEVVVVDEVGREVHRGPVRQGGRRSSKTVSSRRGDTQPRQDAAGDRGTADTPPAAVEPARRKGDRWATFNAFVDGHLVSATDAEVRVWMVIYREVRPGGLARVGMSDIARRAGLTRRGVVKAIAGLKQRCMVELVTRGNVNGSPNVYRLAGAVT